MATNNRDSIDQGFQQLKAGLLPFVKQNLSQLPTQSPDTGALLELIESAWDDTFSKVLGPVERSLVGELRALRRAWIAEDAFTSANTFRGLDSMHRLLQSISARDEAIAVEQLLLDVQERMLAARRRAASRRATMLQRGSREGLPGWRSVIAPHPDVASGRFQEAEFAADLDKVFRGQASSEYADPVEFFRRTFLTMGLHGLLQRALRRLTGTLGGDPVIELQTNFGGGKTHSMLALYHLFSGHNASSLAGLGPLLAEQDLDTAPKAARAVLVGTALSPGKADRKPDGTEVNTLWGELAWQLGGAEGYAMLAEEDQRRVSPGSVALKHLFDRYAPCLVLIDEWVAYARQTVGKNDLPGGNFDAQATFAQALTEAAKAADRTLVVASIPASRIEVGGEHGQHALDTLKDVFQRLGTSWQPATAVEGFEIVRRRLFENLPAGKGRDRDAVVDAFARMYEKQSGFPSECRDREYRDLLTRAYPFHPALFSTLYEVWSTLDKFQRTRGVLRLLSRVIHVLWQEEDAGLLIMPSSIPVDDVTVKQELTRYLEDNWEPVISKDIDGPDSLAVRMDSDTPTLGKISATRRVARTIYIGSAPGHKSAHPGIDEREIRLGCAQPGESVPLFDDALRRLTHRAMYLFQDESARFWYSTRPSLNRVAEDRAARVPELDVLARLVKWLNDQSRMGGMNWRGPFPAVQVCPRDTADIPDESDARLIVLGPQYTHKRKNFSSKAINFAEEILEKRGTIPRQHRNVLAFLAPDHRELSSLLQAMREWMAWSSILDEKDALDLSKRQTSQAKTRQKQASQAIDLRIAETWQHVLTPFQETPTEEVEWEEEKIRRGAASIAATAGDKLVDKEKLLTKMGGERLRMELDNVLWKGDVDHLDLNTLWGYFTDYTYLPRLRSFEVLRRAVLDGMSVLHLEKTFAVAERYDAARERYVGLALPPKQTARIDRSTLLVKPPIAKAQYEREANTPPKPPTGGGGGTRPPKPPTGGGGGGVRPPVQPPVGPSPTSAKTRFTGEVTLDADQLGGNAAQIQAEILRHLSGLPGAQVTVRLQIEVEHEDGFDEQTIRTVSENSNTLGFDYKEFS